MSMRYKGSVISATPPTLVTNAGASGAWTLEQQMQANAAGLWPKNGPFNYIEDVFSTWLYTGNGSTQTINNGIDLAGKGGLVWVKNRGTGSTNHLLMDTARVAASPPFLSSNNNAAQVFTSDFLSFNSNGFSFLSNSDYDVSNQSGQRYVSWTFRKQPKFYTQGTYTGNNTAGRTIAHDLGSVPGCIIIKQTDGGGPWTVYHRSPGATKYLILNNTDAEQTFSGTWNNTAPTATEFTLGASGFVNAPGASYVYYAFAHNAGGFGLSGTDNVISCGSYTAGSSETTVNLGFEPQWTMIKASSTADEWRINDNMRGVATGGIDRNLWANLSNAEAGSDDRLDYNATGFTAKLNNSNPGETYIYIAIRRGPMKVPTTGTSVFQPVTYTGNGATTRVLNTTITPDAGWFFHRDTANGEFWFDRLRGGGRWLQPSTTGSESSWTGAWLFDVQNAVQMQSAGADYINGSGALNGLWALKRAPGFFDEVCYTGTGVAGQTFAHNLGVAPEMMIVKSRSNGALGWYVYSTGLGPTKANLLNQTNGQFTSSTFWNNTAPTPSVFTLGSGGTNGSGNTQVAYLFATCPGVSKVGSYTGNGTTQTINCGFTGGSRFVLIKRTDADSDWYVWDSARGIVAGNDPYLLLNSTAAEVTGTDAVDTDSTGFVVNRLVSVDVNENGGSYIFLAIA